MRSLYIDNYRVDTPLLDIIYQLQATLTNGKLRDVKPGIDNIVVTCPNNEHANGAESTPACNIYIGDNEEIPYGMARCFVCGFKGSFVHFVAHCFNSPEEYAKNWLIKNFGVYDHEKIVVGEDIKFNVKKVSRSLDESVLDNFQRWTPYLQQRGITRETADKFKLRYDPKNRQVIFPYFNEKDKLVTLLTRQIDNKIFYIEKGIEKPIYGINEIFKNNTRKCVITEGLFDCLLGNQYGMPTIATLGQPSKEQIELINKSPITVLYLMFDNDNAGRQFNRQLHRELSKRILIVDVNIVGKKDIGDLTKDEFWYFINKAK